MNARGIQILSLASVILMAGCGAPMSHASPSKHSTTTKKTVSTRKNVKSTIHKTASKVTTGGASSKKLAVIGYWAHHKALPASSLSASAHSLTYISPFWYTLTSSGTIKDKMDTAVLAAAHKFHIPIIPLVGDSTGRQAFLSSNATRKTAVQSIDHLIATMHYQGVDIDFEPPHTSLKPELTAFMVQLRDSLPSSDRILIDVVPHSGGAYDYAKLAPEVTGFQLMSYDQHSRGTPAGPVAALNWVSSLATRLKKVVPPSKIYLGVALYGYEWPIGTTHAVTIPYDAITPAIKAKGVWNTRYQEMTAHIGGNVYWWENRKGIAQKIALAKKDHLAGIALWQVGYANSAIYHELLKNIGKQS